MLALAIKGKDCNYIASISNGYTQISCAYNKSNMPLWWDGKKHKVIFAYSGDYRELNVMKYFGKLITSIEKDDFKLTPKVAVNEVFKNSILFLQKAKIIKQTEVAEDIAGSYLLISKDGLFKLDGEGYVYVIDDCLGIGPSNHILEMGYRYLSEKVDDITYKCLKLLSQFIGKCDVGNYPILLANTNNPDEIKTYGQKETYDYIGKFESEHKII